MSDTNTPKNYTLTTRNLFKHFLLLHDFLYNFTKTKARNGNHLDTQLDVSSIMNRATLVGSRIGQGTAFVGFIVYCLKSRNIPMKFFYGFLYVYWMNHFATLGSYSAILIRIPQAYGKVGNYFEKHEPSPNKLDLFEELMSQRDDYDDTHQILAQVFPQTHEHSGDSFLANDYFAKNKDKYNISENSIEKNSLRLPYLDSFLTRYVYYSFFRWFSRVKLFIGFSQQ